MGGQCGGEHADGVAGFGGGGASCAGERLSSFSDNVIERVFEDLKPAHSFVRFTYTG